MRRKGWIVGGVLAGLGVLGRGQIHKVARPETVVRAVGVYEWTGDLAKPKGQRFVPVTIFIDGELQDAGVYLARPVPMALAPGNLYELDDAGVEKGLVDVKEARHLQIPANADIVPYDNTWLGYGSFEAPSAPKALPTKKPSQRVSLNGKPVADDDSDRPKFSSRGAQPGTGGSAAPASGSPEDVTIDGDKKDSNDDVDRPTLRRRPPADPKQAKKDKKARDQSSVTGEKQSLNDDPDRPRMKRSHETDEDELAPLNGLPADMHQMVGVSDPKRRDPHPFARAWEDENEHQAILKQMRDMAHAQLVAYGPVPAELLVAAAPAPTAAGVAAGPAPNAGPALKAQDTSTGAPPVLRRNHVDPNAAAKEQVTAPVVPAPAAPAKTAPAKTGTAKAKTGTAATPRTAAARRVAAAKAKKAAAAAPDPQYQLVDEELKGYTLSYGGAPTYVYTAHTLGTGAALRYVTIVAQADGVNGLKMAVHSVTDAAHLDRQAWMRFVDVVDVEASNRASLLFELRGQTSRQFALLQVVGGKSDTLFTGGTTQ